MLCTQSPTDSFCVPMHLSYAMQDFFGVAATGSWQAIVRGAGHTQFLTAGEQTLLELRAAAVGATCIAAQTRSFVMFQSSTPSSLQAACWIPRCGCYVVAAAAAQSRLPVVSLVALFRVLSLLHGHISISLQSMY